jgi:hypothetical protein
VQDKNISVFVLLKNSHQRVVYRNNNIHLNPFFSYQSPFVRNIPASFLPEFVPGNPGADKRGVAASKRGRPWSAKSDSGIAIVVAILGNLIIAIIKFIAAAISGSSS